MIFHKLRRRQSGSLPSSHPPTSYVHHASTPPEWPTTPTQATPDVYITSPPEDESGLQTSVCVHRAVEHEPKKMKKRDSLPAEALDSQGPPTFKRSSIPAVDVIMPKKASDLGSPTKRGGILSRQQQQPQPQQPVQEQIEVESPAAESGVEPPAATAHVQWEGGHQLTRVSSSRDLPIADETPQALAVRKHKDTLRRRASQLFKTFTNRESAQDKHHEARPNGRRNTLSDGSRPFSIWTKAATAHAIPTATVDDSAVKSPKTSGEGRRRSSTIAGGERPVLASPPLPPLPVPSKAAETKDLPAVPAVPASPLDSELETVEPAASGAPQKRKLQKKRSKNTFSHLFNLKSGEKQHLRSPPPAKQEDTPVPPVPTIPEELAKAVADPDTPELNQTPTLPATPKSTKSKRLLRRRRATIDSISHSPNQTPSSLSTDVQTPKTPSSLRSRPFSIIDLRKGFSMRSLGKNKSSKSSPASPPPPVPVPAVSPEEDTQAPATVMQRYKASRPPPLQSSNSLQGDGTAPMTSSTLIMSPTTVEFGDVADAVETALSSPTESESPITPMFGTQPPSSLAPAIQLNEAKSQQQVEETPAPELTFTPPTSEEGDRPSRASRTSEATLTSDDPLFGALDQPSSLGDLSLQLHEPATKTSTLDAHLKLDSLRFENFTFNTDVF